MLKTAIRKAKSYLRARTANTVLQSSIDAGLPTALQDASRFLITGKADAEAVALRNRVEARRTEIASEDNAPVPIYYSPKPGSASVEEGRFDPGAVLSFSRKRIASTGKDALWGTFLHLLSRDSNAETILELGACAGLSALYLGHTPAMRRLVTIEAAPELATIARETLAPLEARGQVITGLFNDVLDQILPPANSYDFVYIDGHHEKDATIHYFERLKDHLRNGALVLFDDINWSADMRAGWDRLRFEKGFSHAVDYGVVGVCVWDGETVTPKQFDLRGLTGSFSINSPHGWKHADGAYIE